MDKAKEALWTKSFVLDTLINFLVFLIYYLLIVIIAVVAKDNLHATASQAGIAVGIYIIGTVVARLLAGRFISILGCRKMLYLGLLIYLISTAMYFYTPNLLMLDSVRFLNGFAYGITSTATSTIIAAIIPTSRRGEGINYYGLSTSLAAAVGPFLGILMLHSLGYDFIIAFCVALIILCGIGSVIMKFNEPKLGIESEAHKGIRISDYIEPRMNSISLVSILVGFAYSGVIGFMAAYTKDLNLILAGTFFFVVYAVVITITRPLLGIVFDMKGENFVLYPCFISLALGIFLLSIAHSTWLILLSAVFVGLGYGTFMSNGQAVTVKIVPVHRIGVATSTYFIALDMGLGFGPYILGAIKEEVGYTSMFHVTVVVALLAFVAYYLLYGRYVGTDKDLSLKARAEEEQIRNAFIEKLNALRAKNGLPKLAQNTALNTATKARASEVVNTGGVTASVHGDGGSLEKAAAARAGYQATGNLLYNVVQVGDSGSPEQVAEQLLKELFTELHNVTPSHKYGHRNTLLERTSTEVGVGVTISGGYATLVQHQNNFGAYNGSTPKQGVFLDGNSYI